MEFPLPDRLLEGGARARRGKYGCAQASEPISPYGHPAGPDRAPSRRSGGGVAGAARGGQRNRRRIGGAPVDPEDLFHWFDRDWLSNYEHGRGGTETGVT